jgi:16S rRNA (cytidine1402-2'-O)-methyltransferase
MGTLYVIGTPIGNLEDFTLRASRILSSVPLVAAEDTRVTRRLLAHIEARPRLLSCHEHNWKRQLPRLLEALAEGDVALTTDAGSPAISDPGAGLVAAVADAGQSVATIPGVSAVTAALSVAGFPADRFAFLGFLPRRRSERAAILTRHARHEQTIVLFEAPHRLRATLADIADALHDPSVAVCRELTKLHEEVWRGTASDGLTYFTEPRGEFTIVIGPATLAEPERSASEDELLEMARRALTDHRAAGKHGRDAVAEVVTSTGLPRRAVYALWVETGDSTPNQRDGV